MERVKRVVSLVLCFVMVFGLLPTTAFAATVDDSLTAALDEAKSYTEALTVNNSSNDPETVVKNFGTHFTWDNEKRENSKSYLFDWSYYNGVVFEGIEYLYEVTGNTTYKDYVVEYMSSLIAANGTWATCSNNSSKQCAGYNSTHGADCYKTASLLLDSYEMTGDSRYLTMAKTLYADLDSAANSYSLKNAGYNYRHTWASDPSPDLWLDGLYMILPFRAEYAKYIDDQEELDLIVSRMQWVSDNMYNSSKGLFYHAADSATSNSGTYWLRSIGWYAAAIVDIMDSMEGDNLEAMKAQLVKLVDSMKACQNTSNGMWLNNMAASQSSSNPYETSGTALVCYAVMKAVNNGWLDESYADMAILAFKGICNEKLNGTTLTDICFKGAPGSSNSTFYDNEGKGVGPFIMFYAEVLEYVNSQKEEPEATEPEVTEPEVTEPEVTEPEVTEPEVVKTVKYIQVVDGDGAAYAVGDALLLNVLVTYSDSSTAYVTHADCQIVVYDANNAEIALADAMNTVGTYSATVYYEGADAHMTFTVGEREDFEGGNTSYDTLSLIISGAELTADIQDVTSEVAESVATISGLVNYVAYDIEATLAEGETAQVSIPVPADWDAQNLVVYHITDDGVVSDEVIEGYFDATNRVYTFTAKHFSTWVLGNVAASGDWIQISAADGTTYQLVSSMDANGGRYLIASGNSGTVNIMAADGSVVSANVTDGTIYSAAANCVWTFTKSGSGYTIADNSGTYMYPSASYEGYLFFGSWTHSLSTGQSSPQVVMVSNDATELYRTVTSGSRSADSYVTYESGAFDAGESGTVYLFKEKSSTSTPEYAQMTGETDYTVYNDGSLTWAEVQAKVEENITVMAGATNSSGSGAAATTDYSFAAASGTTTGETPVAGDYVFNVVYKDVTLGSVTIHVKDKSVTSVTVKSAPVITTCVHEVLTDFPGVVLTVNYSDGFTEEVTEGITYSYNNAVGTQVVTATYEGKNATFNITVEEETPTGVLGGETSFEFNQNSAANFTGLTYTLTYDCGHQDVIDSGSLEVGGYDLTTPGTYNNCPVTYNGTQVGTVTVVVHEVTAISKDGYLAGETYYELDDDGVDSGEEYLIVNTSNSGNAYVFYNNSGTDGAQLVTIDGNGRIAAGFTNESSSLWRFTSSGNTYQITNNNQWLSIRSDNNSSDMVSSSEYTATVTHYGSGAYRVTNSSRYLAYSNGWTPATSSNSRVYLFRPVTSEGQKLTFTLDQGAVMVRPGATTELTGTVVVGSTTYDLDDCDITWTASNSYASVSNGTVTGVADGTTTVTATLNKVNGTALANPISLDVTVTVQSKEIASAQLVGNDPVYTKQNVEPDFSGISLIVNYKDGTSAVITTKNGLVIEGYDIDTIGFDYATISYAGKEYGTVRVTVEGNPYEGKEDATEYPVYPSDGAVRIEKTAKEMDFADTGLVQVELDVAGVSVKGAVDVILVTDLSNSMAWAAGGRTDATSHAATKMYDLAESVNSFADIFLAENEDGSQTINTMSLVTFGGYDADHTEKVYSAYADPTQTLILGTKDASLVKTTVGNIRILADDALNLGTSSTGYYLSFDGGQNYGENYGNTNYDHAFMQTANAITALKNAYAEANDGASYANSGRQIYVIFMTDGAPSNYDGVYYNYKTGDRADVNCTWINADGEEVTYTMGTSGAQYQAGPWFQYIAGGTYNATTGTIPGNPLYWADQVYNTPGVADIINIGFDLDNGGFSSMTFTESDGRPLAKVLEKMVTGKTLDVYSATDAEGIKKIYADLATELRYAGTQAEAYDVIDSDFTLQMSNTTGTEGKGIGTVDVSGYNPSITVKLYDLWTKSETSDNSLIGTRQKDENGNVIVDVVETVTFNADGTAAYSNLVDNGATNIMSTETDGTVIISAHNFTYTKTPEGHESFDWSIGNITDKEIALSFMAYLKGSLEGEQPNGLKYTNEEAVLEYIDINGKHATQTFPVPAVAWGGASTAYEFYLVNYDGKPCDRDGNEIPFANRIIITGPFYQDLYLNQSDEEIAQEIIAVKVLPAGYQLYDDTAKYTVRTASGNNTGSLIISDPAEGKAQTTIQVSAVEPSFIQSRVAFGVIYTVLPEESEFVIAPDQVVIDYGKPIVIDVNTNNTAIPSDATATLVGFSMFYDTVDVTQKFTNTPFSAPFEATYGTFSLNANGTVTYTPHKLINNIGKIFCVYEIVASTDTYYMVSELDVIPATVMYYETDFADGVFTYSDTWTEQSKGTADSDPQNDGTIGNGQTYGYDSTYNDDLYLSNGTSQFAAGNGADVTTVTFSFTGTGFDLISRTGEQQGLIKVEVATDAKMTNIVKTVSVLNKSESQWELYQIPVVSIQGLSHGTYYVKIGVEVGFTPPADKPILEVLRRGNEFYFDAIRVYDPAQNSDLAKAAYNTDGEANEQIHEVRELLLDANKYAEIQGVTTGMVFIDKTQAGTNDIATYATIGPNNETYLAQNQAVAFKFKANSIPASFDIGAKCITDEAAGLKVMICDANGNEYWSVSQSITSSTIQFIDLLNSTKAQPSVLFGNNAYVVITNTGSGVLSVTDIKTAYSVDTAILQSTAAGVDPYGYSSSDFVDNGQYNPYAVSYSVDKATASVAKTSLLGLNSNETPVVPEEPEVDASAYNITGASAKSAGSKWNPSYTITVETSELVEDVQVFQGTQELEPSLITYEDNDGTRVWIIVVSKGVSARYGTFTLVGVGESGIQGSAFKVAKPR